jgi:hypothetical protein
MNNMYIHIFRAAFLDLVVEIVDFMLHINLKSKSISQQFVRNYFIELNWNHYWQPAHDSWTMKVPLPHFWEFKLIYRVLEDCTLTLTQEGLIKLVQEFKVLEDCHASKVPVHSNEEPLAQAKVVRHLKNPRTIIPFWAWSWHAILSSFNFYPDIAFAVHQCAFFSRLPSSHAAHEEVATKILCQNWNLH